MCELCDLVAGKIVTRLYYRDKTCTIVDCSTRHIPMLVFNHHGKITELEEWLAMTDIKYLFDYESIEKETRKIQDHVHWYIIGAKYLGA